MALIDRVEQALGTPVQTVVKREDEQAFARLNGENLMFCEDAARRMAAALAADPRSSASTSPWPTSRACIRMTRWRGSAAEQQNPRRNLSKAQQNRRVSQPRRPMRRRHLDEERAAARYVVQATDGLLPRSMHQQRIDPHVEPVHAPVQVRPGRAAGGADRRR